MPQASHYGVRVAVAPFVGLPYEATERFGRSTRLTCSGPEVSCFMRSSELCESPQHGSLDLPLELTHSDHIRLSLRA